jgi:hypothetical protein
MVECRVRDVFGGGGKEEEEEDVGGEIADVGVYANNASMLSWKEYVHADSAALHITTVSTSGDEESLSSQ